MFLSEEFNETKYTRWYFDIIGRALADGNRSKSGGYYESHHIVPRALKASKRQHGVVLLTAREHFICHLLLTKMCDDPIHERKMVCAFYAMAVCAPNQTRVCSRWFERFKPHWSKALQAEYRGKKKPAGFGDKVRMRLKGVKKTPEQVENARRARVYVRGPDHFRFGMKNSEEVRAKLSASKKMNPMVGCKNGMFGRTHSLEARRKMAEATKARFARQRANRATDEGKSGYQKEFDLGA